MSLEAGQNGETGLEVVAEQAPVEIDDEVEAGATGLAARQVREEPGHGDGEALFGAEAHLGVQPGSQRRGEGVGPGEGIVHLALDLALAQEDAAVAGAPDRPGLLLTTSRIITPCRG